MVVKQNSIHTKRALPNQDFSYLTYLLLSDTFYNELFVLERFSHTPHNIVSPYTSIRCLHEVP